MKYIMRSQTRGYYYKKNKKRRSYYSIAIRNQIERNPLCLPINIGGSVVVPAFFLKGDWRK